MAQEIVEVAKSYLNVVIYSLLILFVGFGVGIIVKKVTLRLGQEIGLNKIFRKVGVTHNVEAILSFVLSAIIYLITIVLFLRYLGIDEYILYLIVGAVLMLLILTVIVGLKDVIPNFVAWVVIQQKGHVQEGKQVEVNEISGVVEKIGFLETEIKTEKGDVLYVPNSLFLKSKLWVRK